jgi:osmotically-inducible protein OsmY
VAGATIGQTPEGESDKPRFTFRTEADALGAGTGISWWYRLKNKRREEGKRMKSTIALFPVFAVALLLAGAPAQASSKMDNRIEASAKESYVFKTYLKGDAIKIQSKDGVVTLTGSVTEESHKSLARETVAELPGVKKVDNQLEVKGDSPTVNSDLWLVTKVKSTLLFHRNVNGLKTEVSVKDGVVTLRGDATSNAQKDLTTEYAKDVEGVKDVKNEMTVSGASPPATSTKKLKTVGEKIDDASITAQVKMTLLYHRSTSAINTKVKTKNGVVTVSGNAKNAAEKDLVTKFAGDVHGVNTVRNRMTVAGSK